VRHLAILLPSPLTPVLVEEGLPTSTAPFVGYSSVPISLYVCPAIARLQLCTTVCQDHDESCKGWAKDNQCEDNKPFMFRVCPASCGICQILEASDKDEL
jgi:hypothetical protein